MSALPARPDDTVKIAKLAVDTGAWALYEIEDGKVHITKNVANRKPIEEYLKIQKRFRGMSDDDIRYLGEQVAKNCDELERLEKLYQ